jgi:hypothetical protein
LKQRTSRTTQPVVPVVGRAHTCRRLHCDNCRPVCACCWPEMRRPLKSAAMGAANAAVSNSDSISSSAAGGDKKTTATVAVVQQLASLHSSNTPRGLKEKRACTRRTLRQATTNAHFSSRSRTLIGGQIRELRWTQYIGDAQRAFRGPLDYRLPRHSVTGWSGCSGNLNRPQAVRHISVLSGRRCARSIRAARGACWPRT